jgi:hypothetical protein
MTTATVAALFRGWYRPRQGRWEVKVTGPTHDDAWGALIEAIRGLPSGDVIVLSAETHPDATATRRPRR